MSLFYGFHNTTNTWTDLSHHVTPCHNPKMVYYFNKFKLNTTKLRDMVVTDTRLHEKSQKKLNHSSKCYLCWNLLIYIDHVIYQEIPTFSNDSRSFPTITWLYGSFTNHSRHPIHSDIHYIPLRHSFIINSRSGYDPSEIMFRATTRSEERRVGKECLE